MLIESATRTLRKLLIGKEQEFTFRKSQIIKIPELKKIDLYLHIPFCTSLCPYCPYNRMKYDQTLAIQYTKAILNEIEQYSAKLGKVAISSLYIGGGTPTTMTDELGVIIESIRSKLGVPGTICIETSPGDLNADSIRKLRYFGVDLMSLGVQSFNDQCLKALGRNYNADTARTATHLVLSAGFKSVNIDLMCNIPGQSLDEVVDDLREAEKIGANQVTIYPLFTFPYSSIGRYYKMNRVKMPNMQKRRKMYRTIHNHFVQNGYQRVSVWGFKKGDAPRYSSVTRDIYIGLGAGAGSRLPDTFFFNTFSVTEYIKTALSGELPIAIDLPMTNSLKQYFWLYWRFYDTYIDRQHIRKVFGNNWKIKMLIKSIKLLGLARQVGDSIELTERGAFYIHLLQNYFMLGYINKVWSAAMIEPWPDKIEI